MAIGLSHGGSNVYSSSSLSNQVWIGTKDGMALIEGDGKQWRVAGQALKGLHVSSIIVPGNGLLVAGVFFGGVHASEDDGKTWERRDNGLAFNDVYSLAWTRLNGRVRLYAGTEPAHLFYSDDFGLHWTELSSLRFVPSVSKWSFPVAPHIAHTKFITFDPYEPNSIYACIEQGAFLKSIDLGKSWIELNAVGFYRDKNRPVERFYDVHKALIDPRDPKKIYVTGGAGLYVTLDGGKSWERRMGLDWAEDVYPDGLVLNPRQPDIMFVSAAEHNPSRWRASGAPGYAGGSIYRSTDAGYSWKRLQNGLPENMQHEFGALCLESCGDSYSIFAATTAGDIYWSEDGGDHWSLIISGLAPIAKKGHERLLAAS